jgi:pimeloyl-ACP methyl ester carboxylesterase
MKTLDIYWKFLMIVLDIMVKLKRGGVTLFYKESGSGNPPILLVHGGMDDHTHFNPQFEHFQFNHRTVAVDLRGYGQSDKPQQDYTIAGYADDLAWLCSELGIAKPVAIGHSMGGLIVLELAGRFPDLPSAIVILDSPIVPPKAFVEGLKPLVMAMQTQHYREALGQFLSQFIGFTNDPDRKERLLKELLSVEQHVIASTLASYSSYDSAAAASVCRVPVLNVSSGIPFSDITRFHELCPQLITEQTVGSGHYHQLEIPKQINSIIDRFIANTLPSGG